uniref:G protein pathway suppressor 2 n=1 Tax=Callorhinchus milii TaxID=7868 RepID=V9KPB2_CALMI
MPALLERPKMSSAMARALHHHIMKERERKRQEEEEVDKMMEQKMKEEQERKRKKELEERMSLEETKEQIAKMEEKLQSLQEEKHQLFLQLKKVLHEEEKRRAKMKEQSDLSTLTQAPYPQGMTVHSSPHLLNMQEGHGRPGGLLSDRSKAQMFTSGAIQQSRGFPAQGAFAGSQTEHAGYQASSGGHASYPVAQGQHGPQYGPATAVTYTSSQQLRGPSAFQTMTAYLPHQPGYPVHGHFPTQPGFIPPTTGISLQKQLEHANQQSGFTDSPGITYVHPSRPASPGSFTHATTPQQTHAVAGFQTTTQPGPRHTYLQHSQAQRYYHQ